MRVLRSPGEALILFPTSGVKIVHLCLLKILTIPAWGVKSLLPSLLRVLRSSPQVKSRLSPLSVLGVVTMSVIIFLSHWVPYVRVICSICWRNVDGTIHDVFSWSIVLYSKLCWKISMIPNVSNGSQYCFLTIKSLIFLCFGNELFHLLIIKCIYTSHFTILFTRTPISLRRLGRSDGAWLDTYIIGGDEWFVFGGGNCSLWRIVGGSHVFL